LLEMSADDMAKLPNFGRKSAERVLHALGVQ